MTDTDLLALCVLEEAGAEIDDGKAAVARVIKNRMALKYESDGTIAGTVLKWDQFSWAWFSFKGGKYRRIAWTSQEASNVAAGLLAKAPPMAFAHCRAIAQSVFAGTYHGVLYDALTDATLLYLNPRLLLGRLPSWAAPDKFVCTIEHTDFYHA